MPGDARILADAGVLIQHRRNAKMQSGTGYALAIVVAAALLASQAIADGVTFRHVFDDSVLDVGPQPGETFTEAVISFHATGRNPYVGDSTAAAQGRDLYENWCQSCHLRDGTGRIGPSLVDQDYFYERVATDAGLFEVIYAGAAGAMQSFRTRMTQDEMLQVIAWLRQLQQPK
jgi:cytochrome c-L